MNSPFPFARYVSDSPLSKAIVLESDPESGLDIDVAVQHLPIYSRMNLEESPPRGFPSNVLSLSLRNVPTNAVTFHLKKSENGLVPVHGDINSMSSFPVGIHKSDSGSLWVVKKAMHRHKNSAEPRNMTAAEGTRIEHASDRIYRILGTLAPRSVLYDEKTGLPTDLNYKWEEGHMPLRVSEYLGDDAYHLSDIKANNSSSNNKFRIYPLFVNPKERYAQALLQSRTDMMADVLLGNRDVHCKNVMFDTIMHNPWRIDNGATFNATGFGRKRKPERWEKPAVVNGILPDIRRIWMLAYRPRQIDLDRLPMPYKNVQAEEFLEPTKKLLINFKKKNNQIEKIVKTMPDAQFHLDQLAARADVLEKMLGDYYDNPKRLARELNRHVDWLTGEPSA